MNIVSGHNFQYRIEDRVKNFGFSTFPEESYIDDVELKPRTIDFVALQERKSSNPRGNQLAIVTECKFLNHDEYCYLRPNPKDKKAYFIDGYNTEELFLDENRFHLFRPGTVVMNIIKDNKKKDNLSGAIMQSTKAMLYLRGSGRKLNAKGLFFPVVVYGGPSKIFDQDKKELNNFLFYQSYEWKEPYSQDKVTTRHIYVDVIKEDNLEEYLKQISEIEMDFLMGYDSFYQRQAERKNPDPSNPAR